MSPQQMTGVTQQQPQQQWQQAAHQTQQAQMYVYAPGYGQNAYAAPQTQNGQYYQYYQYAGYPQQMYQAQPAAYYYYPNTAQQPPVMYQQQQMMYQMPPPVAQQTAVPPAATAPAAPATAPQMTQSQQQRSSAPVAPPAAGVNVPAASSVPTVPAIASTQQPLPVEEPVASEVSVVSDKPYIFGHLISNQLTFRMYLPILLQMQVLLLLLKRSLSSRMLMVPWLMWKNGRKSLHNQRSQKL